MRVDAIARKTKRCQIMKQEMPCELYVYGFTHAQNKDNRLSTEWAVKAFQMGANGLRIWNFEGDGKSFDSPESQNDNDLIIDAMSKFGIQAVASLRLKALRRGQQDVERAKLNIKGEKAP